MSGANKGSAANELQQKTRVIAKLSENGISTEKDLQMINIEHVLKLPNITIGEMNIILELQKASKSNRLFSYLGSRENTQE